MKQTIAILCALILSLMTVTGFIVYASLEQNRLIDSLRTRQDELALDSLQSRQALEQVMQERDALSRQLNDAVLSSQEANDAVALQQSQNAALEQALAAARMEMQTLRRALENAPSTPTPID